MLEAVVLPLIYYSAQEIFHMRNCAKGKGQSSEGAMSPFILFW